MTAAAPAYRVQLPWCAVRRSASLVIEGGKMNASLSSEAKTSCRLNKTRMPSHRGNEIIRHCVPLFDIMNRDKARGAARYQQARISMGFDGAAGED